MAIAITVVLGIGWSVFMVAVGHSTAASSTTTTSTVPARAVETYVAPVASTTTTVAPTTTTTPAVPTTKALRDGTMVVGTEVEPGTYRSSASGDCYWSRLRNFTGKGDIIANDFVTSGPAIVTIQPGDVGFKSSGCGRWERIG